MKKEITKMEKSDLYPFLGVRTSIWKVVAVVASAAVGALISGHLYSDYTTLGAVIGILLGESFAFASKKAPCVTNEEKA